MKKTRCYNLKEEIEWYNKHYYKKYKCKIKNKKHYKRTIKKCCKDCPLQYSLF